MWYRPTLAEVRTSMVPNRCSQVPGDETSYVLHPENVILHNSTDYWTTQRPIGTKSDRITSHYIVLLFLHLSDHFTSHLTLDHIYSYQHSPYSAILHRLSRRIRITRDLINCYVIALCSLQFSDQNASRNIPIGSLLLQILNLQVILQFYRYSTIIRLLSQDYSITSISYRRRSTPIIIRPSPTISSPFFDIWQVFTRFIINKLRFSLKPIITQPPIAPRVYPKPFPSYSDISDHRIAITVQKFPPKPK